MNQKKLTMLTFGLVILLATSAVAALVILDVANKEPSSEPVRVACVGDSLTQSSEYPYNLWLMLGNTDYDLRNFGAGATTVSLSSETPYMNTSVLQDALDFQPNIVIIMLGTNDAQPSLHQYNATFVDDYKKLVTAFQRLASEPKIWVVLPPPIFSNEPEKISPEYFSNIVIPSIEQAASEMDLPIIDVHSVLTSPDYFSDGVHVNGAGAKLIADEIYKAITS